MGGWRDTPITLGLPGSFHSLAIFLRRYFSRMCFALTCYRTGDWAQNQWLTCSFPSSSSYPSQKEEFVHAPAIHAAAAVPCSPLLQLKPLHASITVRNNPSRQLGTVALLALPSLVRWPWSMGRGSRARHHWRSGGRHSRRVLRLFPVRWGTMARALFRRPVLRRWAVLLYSFTATPRIPSAW
jgi:hypothetical protein